jgi:3-hydroxyisobutyrate dehydrogenase
MSTTQTARPAGREMVTETIAVLGAGGTMGFPIARNLARAGLAVRAWNRSAGKVRPLTEDGAYLARTPGDAVTGAGLVLTMLADEDAVFAAMNGPDGALPAMAGDEGDAEDRGAPRPAVWIQMSTIGEAATRRCAALASRYGVEFVDAPVLGTRQPAEEGKLVVLESGPEGIRSRVQPVFDAIGHRTIHAGLAGAGSRLKLVANNWLLAVVEGAAETIALAEGLGIDPALFLEAVADGPLDLPYLQLKGKAITERDFTPAFKLALAAKDAGLVRHAAREHDLDLPLVEAIARRFADAAGQHGEKDLSATYLASTPRRD